VNPSTISKAISTSSELPNLHDKEIMAKLRKSPRKRANRTTLLRNAMEQEISGIDYISWNILRRVANLFRIYPAIVTRAAGESSPRIRRKKRMAFRAYSAAARIQKANLQAIAYIQTALVMFRAKNTKEAITTWFGKKAYTSVSTRKRVQFVMNSIQNVLGNVATVYPGPECDEDTYAYVFPEGDECEDPNGDPECSITTKGEFVFYMCPLSLKKPNSELIETMTHEASHHATAYTDDVDFEGDTAYGRDTCKRLAAKNAKGALDNADNFCYYIQDVTDASGKPCEGLGKDDCNGACMWKWTGSRKTSCQPAQKACEGLKKSECDGDCTWNWTGNRKTSCQPGQQTCDGLKKSECDGACAWQWNGNWRTSCRYTM